MTRRLVLAATAVVLSIAALAAAHPAGAATRLRLPRSGPAWARAASRVGTVRGDEEISFRVYLHTRDDAGLAAFASSVSDPNSPLYRQFLTPAALRTRFGPSDATVGGVKSWLAANGMTVLGVPANNLYVEARGSAAQVSKAFDTSLSNFRVQGRVLRAPDTDLSVPASVATSVAGVVGVDQSQLLMTPRHVTDGRAPRGIAPPSDGFRNAPPCSEYWAQKRDTTDPAYGGGFGPNLPYAPCGYTPPQLRSAYGVASTVNAGHTGSSATVAIIDAFASPTIFADASRYASLHDPAHPLLASQFSQKIFPPNTSAQSTRKCDASGWYGEETLDVEAVHATAPGAKIVYVGASDCFDPALDKALNDVVANHRAQIVTNSYGDTGEAIPSGTVAAFSAIVTQAAAEGIGVYFSSGDDGDEVANLGHPAADFPASSPFVTAVGGTSLGIAANGSVAIETGWSTGKSTLVAGAYQPAAPGAFLYGSGGGTSTLFAEPQYQKGVVPDSLATINGPAGRVVPDISVVGDPSTGMLVGQTQLFPGKEGVHYDEYRIGGTSLSAPLLAGIVALADDLQGHAHGFINPSLYSRVRPAGGLRDITHASGAVVRVDFVNGVDAQKGTTTSVRTFDFPRTITTTSGYDRVTGLGVPAGLAFLMKL